VALRSAFAKQGLVVDSAEIGAWRGASKRDMVRHFVELRAKASSADQAKLCDTIYRDFNAQLDEAYNTVPPIDGVEQAFERMRSAGLLLATTSGFDRKITASIFHRLNWQKFFVASISGEDVAQGRPAPFMIFHAMEIARVTGVNEVVAVGDTPLTLGAGRAPLRSLLRGGAFGGLCLTGQLAVGRAAPRAPDPRRVEVDGADAASRDRLGDVGGQGH